jgi:hypothetical protein
MKGKRKMTKEIFDRANAIFNEHEYLTRLTDLIRNAGCDGAKLEAVDWNGDTMNREILQEDIKNDFLNVIFKRQAKLWQEFENL